MDEIRVSYSTNQGDEIVIPDPEGRRNIVVIGNSGAGKSLFSAILSNNYETFQISDKLERYYAESKFVEENFNYSNQNYCIFDYEGASTCDAYKNLLQNHSFFKG